MTKEQIAAVKSEHPELIALMSQFSIGGSQKQQLKAYRKFLRAKDKMSEGDFYAKYICRGYKSNTIDSPTFGKKTFYKSDLQIMYWDVFVTV
jgi:hypothetical protein